MANCYGRYKILTSLIPNGNIAHDQKIIPEIIKQAMPKHQENVVEMNRLYDYLFNRTDIMKKEKTSRPDVNNKISKPICHIACVRKNTYCFGKPFQFISAQAEEKEQDAIKQFNDALRVDNYAGHLTEVTLNSSWAGLGYKYVEKPNQEEIEDGMYFKSVTDIDPRQAFCVYANTITKDKVLGVIYYTTQELEKVGSADVYVTYTVYNVFTKWHKWIFKNKGDIWTAVPFNLYIGDTQLSLLGFPYRFDDLKDGTVVAKMSNIPLIEYQRNTFRINDFELAIDLINCANTIISNAVDKIQQNVDYVLKLKDIDVGEWDDEGKNPVYDTIQKYLLKNLLPIKSNEGATTQPDADIMDVPLDIAQVKDLLEFIKQEIYESLFIPTRGVGTGQDTGKAVERRNGFTELEDFAGITVSCVKESEREFVKLALQIAKDIPECPFKDLKSKDVIVKDVRNSVEDMQEQTQAFATLINSGVNRTTAYEITKLVADAIDTTKLDEAYAEAQAKKLQEQQARLKKANIDNKNEDLANPNKENDANAKEENKDVIETAEK